MINVLDLISSTVYFFPTCFVNTCQELISELKKLVQHFFTVSNLGRRQVELQKLSIEHQVLLADQSIRVCEALCWSSALGNWYVAADLQSIAYALQDRRQPGCHHYNAIGLEARLSYGWQSIRLAPSSVKQ
jgi:hypothetical protein